MKTNIKIFIFSTVVLAAGITFFTWRRKSANYVAKFIGISELGNNQGFSNAVFQSMMKNVGWISGEAWCAYLVKAVYLESYPAKADKINSILTGSTQQTWKNAKNNPDLFKVLDQKDSISNVGDIVIWQSTKNTAYGHTGIVFKKTSSFNGYTIEGNTNFKGVADGQGVEKIETELKIGAVRGSLKLLGFIRLKNNLF